MTPIDQSGSRAFHSSTPAVAPRANLSQNRPLVALHSLRSILVSIDLEHLRTFLEVGRTRHFGKAADNLFVTQSTVSARIRMLEERLGLALFTRTRNDIQLTAAGNRLQRYAESIVTTWNRARQEIAVEPEGQSVLAVAGMPSLWDIVLQDWLHRVYHGVSEVVLQAEALAPELIARRLLDGSLDLGFVFEAPPVTGLESTEIAEIDLILVSTQPNLDTEQALGRGYVLVDWGSAFAAAHARFFPAHPTPALRMGLGRMAREFLLSCGGAAYLASPMIEADLKAKRLHLVTDAPVIRRNASALFSADTDKSELVAQVLTQFGAGT